jgi:hypothetical protein
VIAAEPELGDLVYGLRSLEDGFVPPIFDESVLDRRFLVNVADSVRATRRLTEREGVFAGISSGAVLHVGLRVASELERGDVVCLLADGGWKYLSTQAWAPELERARRTSPRPCGGRTGDADGDRVSGRRRSDDRMSDPRPIGIFDSGVGGLTVARAVFDLLPNEPILYVGDNAASRTVRGRSRRSARSRSRSPGT